MADELVDIVGGRRTSKDRRKESAEKARYNAITVKLHVNMEWAVFKRVAQARNSRWPLVLRAIGVMLGLRTVPLRGQVELNAEVALVDILDLPQFGQDGRHHIRGPRRAFAKVYLAIRAVDLWPLLGTERATPRLGARGTGR